jgi:predicted CXXCH cytochrome family protein
MSHSKRLLITLLLLFGLTNLIVGVVIAQDDDADVVTTPEVTAEATAEATEETTQTSLTDPSILETEVNVAIEPTGENGYCTICHDQPLRTFRLLDGSVLNLYVNPAMIQASVHGPTEDSPGLGCLDCHGEDAFPHSDPPPASGRVYTLDSVSLCTGCHVQQGEELQSGLHAMAIADGNLEAAVCTDCHGAHHIQSAESFPELVAGVCGDCHQNTLTEWQISEHAELGPLGCATCHDYHAQTLRVGETTTDLCTNCHNEMEPFYTHDVHLTEDNPVPCESCHMVRPHDAETVSVLEAPSTGHSMLLDTTPCTTCHAELVETGQWAQIISERYDVDVAEPVDVAAIPEETEAQEQSNSVLILQGLLVGLGLGVTFTIVFVTRSLRQSRSE